jgi:hypothetical protein
VSVSATLTPSSDSGENVPLPDQGEQGIIQTSESLDRTVRIADMVDNFNDCVKMIYLKPTLLAKILVYHKHVLTLPCSFLQVDNTDKEDLKLMTRRAYPIKGFPYIDYEVIAPKQMQEDYKGIPIQIPVTKGTAKSTNHEGNVIDVLRQTYNKPVVSPVSLADIGINAERIAKLDPQCCH